jgi:O-methyltransferase involved in polyketide biosynthesis
LLERKAKLLDQRVQRVAVNLADREERQALFKRVKKHRRVVVISEGLLVYLPAALVGELARELAFAPRWVAEMVQPAQLAQHLKYWGEALGHARWQFASDQGLGFFRSFGWSVLEERSFYLESRRLGRTGLRHPRLVHFLGRISPTLMRTLERAVVYGVLTRP